MSFLRLKPAKHPGRTKLEQLASLKRQVEMCEKCPEIAQTRTMTVFGEGDPDASIMFIGEAPGLNEDSVGKPFVGSAGQVLTCLIHGLGLERRDVYIANVLKCRPNVRPGQSNRPPTRPEMLDCAPYLFAQIEIVEPLVIVALGGTALEALGIVENITQARGIWYRFKHVPVVATFHPAYVLRNPTTQVRNQIWRDIRDAWESTGMKADRDEHWVPEIGA